MWMTDWPHGTRRCYQDTPCTCPLCRLANRTYAAQYRAAIRAQRPVLGTHRSGAEARRLVTQLQIEGFTQADIARRFGLKQAALQYADRVTLRTVLKLRRLYREAR